VLAALEQIARVEQVAAELGWRQAGAGGEGGAGSEAIRISIGIASGPVVVGDIGPEFDRSYTVFGEPVDLAQAIERANGVYGTQLLVGEATRAMIGHGVELREVDQVEWADGFRSRLYEVIGRQVDSRRLELRDAYAQALAHYRDCEWAAARTGFELAARLDPRDGPTRTMLGRLDLFMLDPPAKPWSGVWTLSEA
jgi:adenylate cyclase